MTSLTTSKASRIGIAVALSVLGMALHTVREFGYPALLAPSSGFAPVVFVQLALLLFWWRTQRRKAQAALCLAVTGAFQLVGGAIISVLPLPFLPFVPEQSIAHYLTHVILGLTQLPLIVTGMRLARAERELRAASF